ncbi:GNAT family N-acetyltransferase [Jeotgalibacillus campisalis]|uniref:Acetyltransferase n=1 Tax=Jeotgalibacillus campisalis TaxID=220754 RepID=A0A0C2VW90_9BACL|nr:GNAT family N-acetyltransferase [Jeotgalibacillus campisalis]KIL53152.1 acetyltransferase [Jeotgalibacillus campisalis]
MKDKTEKQLFKIDCGALYLQEFSLEEAEIISTIANQPAIREFLPDWSSTTEQREEWLTHYEIPANKAFLEAASQGNIGEHFLKLGVFIKATDECIGWCCSGIKEELPEPNREIVYALSERFQGKGYATKAVQGLINYLFNETNTEILNAIALPRNVSSSNVIKRCGFTFEGVQTIDDEPHHHYLLKKTEWRKMHE